MNILRGTLVVLFSLLLASGFFFFCLPPAVSLRWIAPGQTAFMFQKGDLRPVRWAPLNRISPYLKEAVIAAEDGNFYRHSGIDKDEMEASWKKNVKKERFARGFSTITMQLAKNLYLYRQKTVTRKVLEILIALKMELLLPKDRILEVYLNVIEWGRGVYGAEAAARHYFNKSARQLTAQEAAFLAAIIPNPRKWGQWPPGSYVRRRMDAIAPFGYNH